MSVNPRLSEGDMVLVRGAWYSYEHAEFDEDQMTFVYITDDDGGEHVVYPYDIDMIWPWHSVKNSAKLAE
jgi:signal peptidase I